MREAGVMLVLNSEGYILGVSRRWDPNRFGLPGGKLEVNETPSQAAIRETKEETSITVNSAKLIYVRPEPPAIPGGDYFYSYCFFAEDWAGTPADSDEGRVAWITATDLTAPTAAFPDYNKNMLVLFGQMYPEVQIKW
jgi:8-oxo-dGTP pyrophosphatase MutT (NUDIX family)